VGRARRFDEITDLRIEPVAARGATNSASYRPGRLRSIPRRLLQFIALRCKVGRALRLGPSCGVRFILAFAVPAALVFFACPSDSPRTTQFAQKPIIVDPR
jgi:hypothetical protein